LCSTWPLPVGVLDPGAGALGVRAEELAQPPGGDGLAGVRPRRLHQLGVRLGGAGHGEVAERGDVQFRIE
jgi:hypothetical protein